MHTAVLHQADQMHHAQHYALDRRVEQAPKERLEGHLIADRLDEIRRMGVAHLLRAVGPHDGAEHGRMGWANEVALYCIRGVRATPQFHVSLSRVGKPTGPRDAMLARGAPAHLRPRPRT